MRAQVIQPRSAALAVYGLLPALIVAFYAWTGLTSVKQPRGMFNMLADAFLAGQLHLPVETDPRMLALADPYDREQRRGIPSIHDASFYKGRYYAYWGPATALTLYAPWKLLTRHDLADNWAAVIFASGAFLGGVLLLRRVGRAFGTQPGLNGMAWCVIGVGLCSMYAWQLRRPAFYEVAILAASCWAMFSVYFLCRYLLDGLQRERDLVLASAFFAVAIASRVTYVFGSAMFLVPLWLTWKGRHGLAGGFGKALWVRLLGIGVPLGLSVALLLLYNYARFGRLAEFGMKYALSTHKATDLQAFNFSAAPFYGYCYLLMPVRLDAVFPFWHAMFEIPRYLLPPPAYVKTWESCMGVVRNIPFLWWIVPGLAAVWMAKAERRLARPLVVVTLVPPLTNVYGIVINTGICMRYVIDFLPLLVLCACLCYLVIEARCRPRRVLLVAASGLAGMSVLYGAAVNVALSITGDYDGLRTAHPAVYGKLERCFDFVPIWAARAQNRDVTVRVRNPYGVGQDDYGTLFWMGQAGTVVDLVATREGTAALDAVFGPGPSLPEKPTRALRIVTDGGFQQEVTVGQEARTLSVPVRKGINYVTLTALDKPSRLVRKPDGEEIAVLLGVRNLRAWMEN